MNIQEISLKATQAFHYDLYYTSASVSRYLGDVLSVLCPACSRPAPCLSERLKLELGMIWYKAAA